MGAVGRSVDSAGPANGGMQTAGVRPRVVIADDNARVLDQVASMLSARFDLVARAANGQEAVDAVASTAPDLVVLDISMPVMTGLAAAERLRTTGSLVPIVFLTVHDDEEFAAAARAAGGLGYVVKSRMASDLVPAVLAALDGRPFVSALLAH
jgi:DNA-binding NarL/FixJ family response regulator